jgi:hypothetical protein
LCIALKIDLPSLDIRFNPFSVAENTEKTYIVGHKYFPYFLVRETL